MHRTSKLMIRMLASGIAVLLTVAILAPAYAQNSGRLAIPPSAKPYGKTYGEWGAAWWQWAFGLPATGNPLFDETGADASAGQSGPVWFLCGVFNVSGSAHRTITIPKGTALFFPIINAEWDDICPPDVLTPAELQALASSLIDLVTDLNCEVDGVSVPDLFSYRAPYSPFSLLLPDDNLFQAACGTPPGPAGPLAQDGYYLMLGPLSKGVHTLHFTGTVGPPINFTLDITYDITVVDRQATPTTAALSPMSKESLGRALQTLRMGSSSPTTAFGKPSVVPNPAQSSGVIRFSLSRPGRVDARLFDVNGRVVRVLSDHGSFSAGAHELRVDHGGPMNPGVYFYRIESSEGRSEGRLVVVQ